MWMSWHCAHAGQPTHHTVADLWVTRTLGICSHTLTTGKLQVEYLFSHDFVGSWSCGHSTVQVDWRAACATVCVPTPRCWSKAHSQPFHPRTDILQPRFLVADSCNQHRPGILPSSIFTVATTMFYIGGAASLCNKTSEEHSIRNFREWCTIGKGNEPAQFRWDKSQGRTRPRHIFKALQPPQIESQDRSPWVPTMLLPAASLFASLCTGTVTARLALMRPAVTHDYISQAGEGGTTVSCHQQKPCLIRQPSRTSTLPPPEALHPPVIMWNNWNDLGRCCRHPPQEQSLGRFAQTETGRRCFPVPLRLSSCSLFWDESEADQCMGLSSACSRR